MAWVIGGSRKLEAAASEEPLFVGTSTPQYLAAGRYPMPYRGLLTIPAMRLDYRCLSFQSAYDQRRRIGLYSIIILAR
jgi:hypothetical protein